MLATSYAKWYNIAPQGLDETDSVFKDRVSGALIDAGHIIEAHEVAQNARHDDDANGNIVRMGIAGALAMALQGVDYGKSGSSLVGDQIAAGAIATSNRQQPSFDELLIYGMIKGWIR